MNSDRPPKLAAPGAGLPKPELLIGRLRFSWARRSKTREQFSALFESERAEILTLASGYDEESGARPVLIKRLRGLEDSSRNWSVFMTLDHLRIVNLEIAEVIRKLGKGEIPSGVASTADVKPDPTVGIDVIGDFERSCDFLCKCAQNVSDLNTSVRYAHPWFGPMDAAGWHALSAFHMSIHRRQIEQIQRYGLRTIR